MLRKQGPRASRRTVRKFPCPMQASPQVIPSPPWPVHACFWPVAAMAVLNVVEPWASSAAGNGSATCLDGKTGKVISMAFTGGAPARLDPDVDPKDLDEGPKAVTVPGAFGGWIELARRYGRRPLSTLLEPAIGYARDGHPLDEWITGYIRDAQASIARYPTTAAIFLPDGKIPAPRGTFRNVPLARHSRRSRTPRQPLSRAAPIVNAPSTPPTTIFIAAPSPRNLTASCARAAVG